MTTNNTDIRELSNQIDDEFIKYLLNEFNSDDQEAICKSFCTIFKIWR